MSKSLGYFCFLLISILSVLQSCNFVAKGDSLLEESGTTSTVNSDTANCGIHEETDDYVLDSDIVNITLSETSASCDSSNGVSISGSLVQIINGGTYKISGSLTDGQIVVNTDSEESVKLVFDGVNIKNADNAPVFIEKAEKVIINLADGTKNYITDGTSYIFASSDEDEPNAALFSKSDLTLYGNGELTVTANYKDGIASKDGLIIKSGTVTVTANDDGIRGKDYLVINSGTFTVKSSADGLKSNNDEDTSKGYIQITGGDYTIVSGTDAIAAQTDVIIGGGTFNLTSGGGSSATLSESSTKGIKGIASIVISGGSFTINSCDDSIHTNGKIVIDAGAFTLSSCSQPIHADASFTLEKGNIIISKSVEGVESPLITINGGVMDIISSDDCLNATYGNSNKELNDGSILTITGGTVYANVTTGDGLDSNGSISITGGTIAVHGPQSSPEVGMDYNGTCNITGGMLIVSGPDSGNMIQGPSTSSSSYSLKLILTSALTAGTLFHIEDSSGNNVVTFKPARSYFYIVFSSPDLKNGSTYNIYTGGTSTGTEEGGLYTGGTYSGGTAYSTSSFTVSSIVTTIGTSSSGGGTGGPTGGGGTPPVGRTGF